MFWRKEKTEKEKYEEEIEKQVDYFISIGEYTIEIEGSFVWIRFKNNDLDRCVYFSIYSEGNYSYIKSYPASYNVYGNIKYFIYYEKNDYNKLSMDDRKIVDIAWKQKYERIQQKIDEEQAQEDEYYAGKLKELLKIKPLDKDLQESFRKANRILEIAEEMKKLRDEILSIRK